MALINCKECGKEISTEAKSCPHCGYKPKKSVWPVIVAWIVAIIMAPVAALLLNNLNTTKEERAEKFDQAKAECSKIGAKIALPGYGAIGDGDRAITAIEDCMSSRGFTVKLRD